MIHIRNRLSPDKTVCGEHPTNHDGTLAKALSGAYVKCPMCKHFLDELQRLPTDKEIGEIKPIPLSQEEIDRIIRKVTDTR